MEIVAAIVCDRPGSTSTAAPRAFTVSTQHICVHSSSPKSAMAADLATHGFHTTVLALPTFSITMLRPSCSRVSIL